MLYRHYKNLGEYLEPNKVLVIYGARRVGKTTLVENFLKNTSLSYKLESGDNIHVQEILSSQDFKKILPAYQNYDLVVIDEAQNIPNIGMGLKILVDQIPGIQIIATGSSSFDLANKIGEPLVGRKRTIKLFPVAQLELVHEYNRHELNQQLEENLIFGGYPRIVLLQSRKEKSEQLHEMVNAYLLKDILKLERVKSPQILIQLLKLLAFQIGSQVSLNELGTHLGLNFKTVGRYLDLLEKSFIIKSLGGFSRNLRKEVYKKQKYYFIDLGIRNAIIANFNDLDTRNDIGQLWENFLFIERMKRNHYQGHYANSYFWRTYDHKEIDLIEETNGQLNGYEFKYSANRKKKIKAPSDWLATYENATYDIIDSENYLDFIL